MEGAREEEVANARGFENCGMLYALSLRSFLPLILKLSLLFAFPRGLVYLAQFAHIIPSAIFAASSAECLMRYGSCAEQINISFAGFTTARNVCMLSGPPQKVRQLVALRDGHEYVYMQKWVVKALHFRGQRKEIRVSGGLSRPPLTALTTMMSVHLANEAFRRTRVVRLSFINRVLDDLLTIPFPLNSP